jgi:molybdopterin-guanine dinucleotide biosynthesis protein A
MELVSGVVLAGGKSNRMGFNKAFLRFGQQHLIERIVATLKEVFAENILVTDNPELYRNLGLPVVTDIFPGYGPLSGIHAGLVYTNTPYIFVVACDMPFVTAQFILFLLGQAAGYEVIVPQIKEQVEPLCAVYHKGCLPVVEARLKAGQYKVSGFFQAVKVKYIAQEEFSYIDEEDKIFINLNTRNDLKRAWHILDREDRNWRKISALRFKELKKDLKF